MRGIGFGLATKLTFHSSCIFYLILLFRLYFSIFSKAMMYHCCYDAFVVRILFSFEYDECI